MPTYEVVCAQSKDTGWSERTGPPDEDRNLKIENTSEDRFIRQAGADGATARRFQVVTSDNSARGIPAISAALRAGITAPASKPTRLHGTVRIGVERGSVVLVGDQGVVLAQLMGGDPTIIADGITVTVTGVFRRDLLTTAQQGPPFQVEDAVAD